MIKDSLIIVLIGASTLLPLPAFSHSLTEVDCGEGSDFIKNAALARDNGMDGMTFVLKTLADIQAVQAFPPHLRWFVRDNDDAEFLVNAVARVFDHPETPDKHRVNFRAECLARVEAFTYDATATVNREESQ